ncbi:MAG TPA: hypothetical protein VGT79_02775 [Xanthomonadaceae bacterium]|nr:hypothetical protein [Xanthomonadaceae bacterium]
MDRVLIDRRNFLVALTGGAALLWFAASRNNNKVAVPFFHVPEVSVAQAKAMLDTGGIAISVRADGCAERFNAYGLIGC